jgi:hypothetical protein
MALKSSEINRAMELPRVSRSSAVGEIWLAYLQLVGVKHRAQGQELFRALDAATGAVLEALREAETLKSRSRPTA